MRSLSYCTGLTTFLTMFVVPTLVWADAPVTAPAPAAPTSAAPAATGADGSPKPDEARLKEASERYQRAVELFKEGDMKLAIIEFRRAYALIPNYQVLYNIGVTSDRLGRYAEAVLAYEQYLKDGGAEIAQPRVEEVQGSLKVLRQRTAYVTLLVDEAKAEVFIDGEKIGDSPLPETLVGAGRHELRVTKTGFENTTETIALAGGDHSTIKVHLTPKKDPVIVGADGGGLGPVWIGWAFTAAGAVATVGLAVAWQGAEKDLSGLLGGVTTRPQLDAAQTKADTLKAFTFVVGGATLVAAAVSLVFTLTRGNSKTDLAKPKTAGVWFDGSTLSGRF